MNGYTVEIKCCQCGVENTVYLINDIRGYSCKDCETELFNASPINGYVYVLSNSSMSGLVKIGYTERSVEERISELNSTGVPTPFDVEAVFCSSQPYQDEKQIHERMEGYRINQGREFFSLGVKNSVQLISEVIGCSPSYLKSPDLLMSEEEFHRYKEKLRSEHEARFEELKMLHSRYKKYYDDACAAEDIDNHKRLVEYVLEQQNPSTDSGRRRLINMVDDQLMLDKLLECKIISSSERSELESLFSELGDEIYPS